MITFTLTCSHCTSVKIIRHGRTRNGNPRFRCHECKRTFCQNPTPRTATLERKAQILAACHERASLRGVARIFKVSRNTITDWLKKESEPARSGSGLAASGTDRNTGTR